jgi:hypothetical protein
VGGLVLGWLGAFLFTQAVEVPIWAIALRLDRTVPRGEERWPVWMSCAVGFGASAITHPIVWFVIPRFAVGSYWMMVGQAEAFAVIVEAVYASLFGLKRALAWSILANATSAGLGLLSRAAFDWP